jgi:hypothetical protein
MQQLVNGRDATQRQPQRTMPAFSVIDLTTRLVTITLVLALLLLLAFDVAPSLRESAAALREYRSERDRQNGEDLRRLDRLKAAQDRQVVNEAKLLLQQRENQRLAEDVAKRLKGE